MVELEQTQQDKVTVGVIELVMDKVGGCSWEEVIRRTCHEASYEVPTESCVSPTLNLAPLYQHFYTNMSRAQCNDGFWLEIGQAVEKCKNLNSFYNLDGIKTFKVRYFSLFKILTVPFHVR